MLSFSLAVSFTVHGESPLKSNNRKLNVGLSLPLSGAVAQYGSATRNGVELARMELPFLSERVNFIYNDNAFDPKKAISWFTRVHSSSEVDVAFVWGSQPCLSVAPLAEKWKFPLMCFSGDPKTGYSTVVSFANPSPDYAKPLCEYIKKQKLKDVVILTSQIGFLMSISKDLHECLPETSRIIAEEQFVPESQDLSSVVPRVRSLKPDAIAVFLLPDHLRSFMKQFKVEGGRTQLLGADTLSSPSLLRELPGLFDEAVNADIAVPDSFRQTYIKKFQSDDNLTFAFNAYQFSKLAGEVSQSSGKLLERFKKPYQVDLPKFHESSIFGAYFEFPIELRRVSGSDTVHVDE